MANFQQYASPFSRLRFPSVRSFKMRCELKAALPNKLKSGSKQQPIHPAEAAFPATALEQNRQIGAYTVKHVYHWP